MSSGAQQSARSGRAGGGPRPHVFAFFCARRRASPSGPPTARWSRTRGLPLCRVFIRVHLSRISAFPFSMRLATVRTRHWRLHTLWHPPVNEGGQHRRWNRPTRRPRSRVCGGALQTCPSLQLCSGAEVAARAPAGALARRVIALHSGSSAERLRGLRCQMSSSMSCPLLHLCDTCHARRPFALAAERLVSCSSHSPARALGLLAPHPSPAAAALLPLGPLVSSVATSEPWRSLMEREQVAAPHRLTSLHDLMRVRLHINGWGLRGSAL